MTMKADSPRKVVSRSELLSLLSEACELEHGLACSYLYSAFTLKQDLAEGGITWQQLQSVRLWAAQIYLVASQEMLHLAQAWNLLTAIGGTPYYSRPNFPQNSKYYPLNVPLETEPFGLKALRRFILYERPAEISPERALALGTDDLETDSPFRFSSVGELYRLIASGFGTIPEHILFVGKPERQVGPELVDFPDLIRVTNRQTALLAIDMITHQGEGLAADRRDCHFGIFIAIREAYEREVSAAEAAGMVFEPVRNTIANPVGQLDPALAAPGGNEIRDPYTVQVADIFNSAYGLMLRMLQYVFNDAATHEPLLTLFGRTSIQMMATVLKPLAESLTMLPAGIGYGGRTAGPPFSLSRHVPLPVDPRAAAILAEEKVRELADRLAGLVTNAEAPDRLRHARRNLDDIVSLFVRLR